MSRRLLLQNLLWETKSLVEAMLNQVIEVAPGKLPQAFLENKLTLLEERIPALREVFNHCRTVYAIGIQQGPNEFGMVAGPHSDLKEMLNRQGDDRAVIIRFSELGEEVTHRWENGEWVATRR